MKLKAFSLSLVLFTFTSFLQITKTDLICDKKWDVKFLKSGDLEMPVPPEKDIWMKFYQDGRHDANNEAGIEKGTWAFTKNKDSIVFIDPKQAKRVVSLDSLSSDVLYLTFVDNGRKITIVMKGEN